MKFIYLTEHNNGTPISINPEEILGVKEYVGSTWIDMRSGLVYQCDEDVETVNRRIQEALK